MSNQSDQPAEKVTTEQEPIFTFAGKYFACPDASPSNLEEDAEKCLDAAIAILQSRQVDEDIDCDVAFGIDYLLIFSKGMLREAKRRTHIASARPVPASTGLLSPAKVHAPNNAE